MSYSLDPSLYGDRDDAKAPRYPDTYPQPATLHHQAQQQIGVHQLPGVAQVAPMLTGAASARDQAPPAPPANGAVPPQEDVDDFLRKKRKAREHKACYPCRQRKVKCDLSRPCQTCRDREHPELCNYHPPNKRPQQEQASAGYSADDTIAGSSGSGNVTLSRPQFDLICQKLSTLEESLADLRQEVWRNSQARALDGGNPPTTMSGTASRDASTALQDGNGDGMQQFRRHTEIHGIHTSNEAGQTVHFGAASIPAILAAMRDGTVDQKEIYERFGKTVLPMFGLDNESATYPFVDLWGLPHGSLVRAQELAKALPADDQMLTLFRYYRDLAHVILPCVVSVEELEAELEAFLVYRSAHGNSPGAVSETMIYGRDFHWLGLLFAVLASGAQTCQMPRKERELTSQVYTCCAFECLRFVNFLSRANLQSLQTLLVVESVLTNNMNAGTAWALHGLTIRLAQGLGLHHPCPPSIPRELVYPRSRIWWAIVWKDSILSIIYDRSTEPTTATKHTMPMPMHYGPVSAYHAAMYPLVKIGLEIVRDRARANEMSPIELHDQIAHQRDAVSKIMREAADYLRDSRKCTNPRENLEHWALYLHSSYYLSELARSAISPRADPHLAKAYRSLCVENLSNTVEAFLGLNNITSYARFSWSAIHRGLGSAILLGILGEHTKNERARDLLARFITAIHDITVNIDPQEIAAPLQRGIAALRRLNIHEAAGSEYYHDYVPAEGANADGLILGVDGSLQLESGLQGNLYTPPDSVLEGAGVKNEHSPYSVLNTILWGNEDPHSGTNGMGVVA
ncbi:hypothetical protein B0A48_14630 [Cryoendolithus antarcticus]|uniref:Zn(2)-C6 fungal-type domain-containing protein n=1 Tax=Cryoendolithus antarcticus TaxID=1507870 RepID=A0A1V8SLN8_9PEZI|nr:hypothetical protein B0A48_14630 [Cryoendolithus antarcticus]